VPVPKRLLLAAIAVAFTGCVSETPGEPLSSASPAPAAAPPAKLEEASSSAPPKPGDPAPDFTLTDQRGERVTLSATRGRPVIVAFYRGHW